MYLIILNCYIFYLLYILLRNRFDFFTLIFIGFSFYYIGIIVIGFSPTLNMYGQTNLKSNFIEINQDFSFSLLLYIFLQIIFMIIYDKTRKKNLDYIKTDTYFLKYMSYISFIISIFITIVIIFKINGNFNLSKAEYNEIIGTEFTFLSYFFTILSSSLIIFLIEKRFSLFKFFVLLFYFILFYFSSKNICIYDIFNYNNFFYDE